jgi:predicted component of type VI protein secretion system
MNKIRHFLVAVLSLAALQAFAQWQWVDKDGRKVFSDRPPPAEVQDKNILKRPPGKGTASGSVAAVPTPAGALGTTGGTAEAPADKPVVSGVDKSLDEKKKKLAEADAAKRKADQERITSAKADNCARAKQAKAGYASGMRIARVNEKGERQVLDEAARTAEIKRLEGIIEADCQ